MLELNIVREEEKWCVAGYINIFGDSIPGYYHLPRA